MIWSAVGLPSFCFSDFFMIGNQILCDLPTNKLNKLNSNQCQLLLILPALDQSQQRAGRSSLIRYLDYWDFKFDQISRLL